ncbi:MAG: GtrA family protein [Deltaproteobacteria bacterium]|nr:GtrA family protein [Deltaproteobacteria bacterium]
MTRQQDLLVRFFKFGVVGGSGVFVNLGIYALLTRGLGLLDDLWASNLAYAFSVEMSILTNFLLNDLWTFSDRRRQVPFRTRLLRFHGVSLVGFGINQGIFSTLNWLLKSGGLVFFGPMSLPGVGTVNVDDLAAGCIGIGTAMFWNFFANLLWTWKGKGETPTSV